MYILYTTLDDSHIEYYTNQQEKNKGTSFGNFNAHDSYKLLNM